MKSDDFKAGLSRFGTGVTVITTHHGESGDAGFTANSFASLSLDPPLVLFCLKKSSDIFQVFSSALDFAVNILSSEQEDISNLFAGKDENKFDRVKIWRGEINSPLITGCLANLECQVEETFPGGDHRIFIGKVKKVHLGAGAPLLYFRREYHSF